MTGQSKSEDKSARLALLLTLYATQTRLTRIVFMLLWRLLVRLPRNVTSFNTLSIDQRQYLMQGMAATKQVHRSAAAAIATDSGQNAVQMAAAGSMAPSLPQSRAQQQATSVTPAQTLRSCNMQGSVQGAMKPTSQQQPQLPSPRSLAAPITTTGYDMIVNVSGHGNVINTDELVQAISRQARAWQTRNRKLSKGAEKSGSSEVPPTNLVVNISGSGCVVGGASTVRQALASKKRQREEADSRITASGLKHEDPTEEPASRRQKTA